MVALFKERALRKLYLALVAGVIAKEEGTIDNFLGKKHGYQGQTVYGSVDEKKKGRRAITYWKCLRRSKSVRRCLRSRDFTGRTPVGSPRSFKLNRTSDAR